MAEEEIAKIIFDAGKKQILDMILLRRDLRFKCKRCAVFCCKLGGPAVTETDLKRLVEIGINPYNFLAPSRSSYTQQTGVIGALKQKKDGSCIFLDHDESRGLYKCRIYEARPSLCRLYPFEFIFDKNETGILRYIPCCNGLNVHDGRMVDRDFIEEHLLDAICESL